MCGALTLRDQLDKNQNECSGTYTYTDFWSVGFPQLPGGIDWQQLWTDAGLEPKIQLKMCTSPSYNCDNKASVWIETMGEELPTYPYNISYPDKCAPEAVLCPFSIEDCKPGHSGAPVCNECMVSNVT